MDDITAAFFQQLYEKIKQLEPSSKKEQLLIKALVVSEMAGLGYSKEIVDKLVQNRKEIERKLLGSRTA